MLAEQLGELLAWLDEIAWVRGALEFLFREEKKAHALPPKQRLNRLRNNNLRLYCLRLNESIVILFNGAEKTTAAAQDCPNVRPYFNQANRLATALDEHFRTGDLKISPDGKQLLFDSNFEIIL